MTREEMIAFIRRHPACTIATCEAEQPRARIIMTFRADDDGIVFMTGTDKAFNRQLQANPRTELCYYDPERMKTLRIAGKMEMIDSDALKAEIVAAFSFLEPVARRQGLGAFTVWRLSRGSACVWDAREPLAAKALQPF